jgi:hypothetical protein
MEQSEFGFVICVFQTHSPISNIRGSAGEKHPLPAHYIQLSLQARQSILFLEPPPRELCPSLYKRATLTSFFTFVSRKFYSRSWLFHAEGGSSSQARSPASIPRIRQRTSLLLGTNCTRPAFKSNGLNLVATPLREPSITTSYPRSKCHSNLPTVTISQ